MVSKDEEGGWVDKESDGDGDGGETQEVGDGQAGKA